jgi:CRP-like cAMP-binding protein
VGCLSLAEKCRILATSPFFGALSPADLKQLAGRLAERSYADQQTIFLRGDGGSSLLAVIEGKVRVSLTSAEGKEVVLALLGPGQILGELSLLDGTARSADATAVGRCRLLALDRRDLIRVLQESPGALIGLCQVLCERIRTTTDRLEGAMLLPLSVRLARLVLSLAAAEGRAQPGGDLRLTAPSQGDLGRLVGASRQKVNLHLRRWTADGLLGRDGVALVICDRDRLADIAAA